MPRARRQEAKGDPQPSQAQPALVVHATPAPAVPAITRQALQPPTGPAPQQLQPATSTPQPQHTPQSQRTTQPQMLQAPQAPTSQGQPPQQLQLALSKPVQDLGLEVKEPLGLEVKEPRTGVPRKAPGTKGRKVALTSNHYPLKIKQANCYRYLVEFSPEIKPEDVALRERKLSVHAANLRKIFGVAYSFDGTNLVSLNEVHKVPSMQDVEGCRVDFTFKASMPTNDAQNPEMLGLFNNLIKILLRNLDMVQFRNDYFDKKPDHISDRLQMFNGFNIAVIPGLNGPMACIALAHRVCSRLTVREMMDDIETNVRRTIAPGTAETKIRDEIMMRHANVFRGRVVIGLYNHRFWRIDNIDYSKTINSSFPMKDGTAVTFKDYYAQTHKLPAPQRVRPGLLVNLRKEKGQFNEDGSQKMTVTHLIPEYCYLTGVTDELAADQRTMRLVADYMRKSPSQRVNATRALLKRVSGNMKAKAAATALAQILDMSFEPAIVDGRVLEPFDVQFKDSVCTMKSSKNFREANKTAGFLGQPIPLRNWKIICEQSAELIANDVGRTIRSLSRGQADVGQYDVEVIPKTNPGQQRILEWGKTIKKVFDAKPKFVLFLVPQGDEALYSFAKTKACVDSGVITQVMKPESVIEPKMMKPVCGNVFKQIMCKLGSTQWKVDLKKIVNPQFQKSAARTMFVGVDVCHDKKIKGAYVSSTSQNEAGSVVGFCATHDLNYDQIHSCMRRQGKNEECVRDSCELMKECLVSFKSKRGAYPEVIMVYRDGVGDSQMKLFVEWEILEYNKAFYQLGISPKVTVVVVQKRGKSRFFVNCEVFAGRADRCPTERCTGKDEFHNPEPGTVIDTVVVSPFWYSFLLFPCDAPPRASSRPTCFLVVRDDLNWSSDDLQALTNQLCFMYANWPGPIRVPAVVMNAHNIAYLFGRFVNGAPKKEICDQNFCL